jgi:class 3 adenylate cyclase
MMGRQVGVERKLAAILCADVYGYSRLMGGDEEATLVTLSAHRKITDRLIEQHQLVKFIAMNPQFKEVLCHH